METISLPTQYLGDITALGITIKAKTGSFFTFTVSDYGSFNDSLFAYIFRKFPSFLCCSYNSMPLISDRDHKQWCATVDKWVSIGDSMRFGSCTDY